MVVAFYLESCKKRTYDSCQEDNVSDGAATMKTIASFAAMTAMLWMIGTMITSTAKTVMQKPVQVAALVR